MLERIKLETRETPHFVGCWKMQNTTTCDQLVAFHNQNRDLHRPGVAGSGKLDEQVKKSLDIVVKPRNLKDNKYSSFLVFMSHLKSCYLDYLEQWGFLKTVLPKVHIGSFNLQKYGEGGHFGALHSERTTLDTLHRSLVWMTYLNEGFDSGETHFPMLNLEVTPEKGKTLIWPAEWTHAHLGRKVSNGEKFIVTGWMHYPIDNRDADSLDPFEAS